MTKQEFLSIFLMGINRRKYPGWEFLPDYVKQTGREPTHALLGIGFKVEKNYFS